MQVVERVAALLQAFTVERPELTLSECSAAAGLSKSSAHRFLSSLEEVQLVERSGTHWRLGPRVVWLATVRLGQLDLRREAAPLLRELGQRLNAATAFSVPNGTEMIYLERFESPDAYGVNARLGGTAPIWGGASGRIVLAQLSADERAARLDADGWRALPAGVRDEIVADIERAMQDGYCVELTSHFFPGVSGVAVAVRDPHGMPVAALSVIVPPPRLTPALTRELGEQLLAIARELEAQTALLSPVA
jgi:IclR family pca regulon transcriptional regulator